MESNYKPISERSRTFFLDIDGCVFRQHWPNIGASGHLLPYVHEKINSWYTNGDVIIFTTSRPESYRQTTEDQLRAAGILWHRLIMDLPTGQRVLINDKKPQDDFTPMAVAINLIRDAGMKDIDV